MLFADKLKLDSERTYTDEGFLQVPAIISRIGVQVYTAGEMGVEDKDPKDPINVYRPPEEVFTPASMGSFANKPITNNHPPELVTADNAKLYSVGMSGADVKEEGDFVKTVLHILDKAAIAEIESGKVELSNGYLSDIEWTPGISPDGKSYDAVQRNIRGNHIAIVERGRAGADCRVADNLSTIEDGTTMAKITINGVDFEVTDQAAQAVHKLQRNLTDAEETIKKTDEELELKKKEDEEAEKKKKEDEEAEKKKEDEEGEKKKEDEEGEKKMADTKTLDALVADRTALIASAKTIMPNLDFADKANDVIRKEVVADKHPDLDLKKASVDYIKARFDALVDDTANNSQHNLDSAFADQVDKDGKTIDNRPESVIARDKFQEDSRNAWKKKDKS